MEKKLSFSDKIDIILRIRKISLKEIERVVGVDGTLYKAYADKREPRKKLLMEVLRKFHVNQSWWNDPVGDLEEDVFEKKGTYVETPIKKDPNEEVRILARNIDRMGAVNEFLLTELKRYKEKFGDL